MAVQLASAQLTPRIIAIVFRDPGTKFSLTVFVFTFTFSLAVLVRINTSVPLLTARLAAYGCVASLGVFLYSDRPRGQVAASERGLAVRGPAGTRESSKMFIRGV